MCSMRACRTPSRAACVPPGISCPTSSRVAATNASYLHRAALGLVRRRHVRILGMHLRSPRECRGVDPEGPGQRLRERLGDLVAEQSRIIAEVLDVALVED